MLLFYLMFYNLVNFFKSEKCSYIPCIKLCFIVIISIFWLSCKERLRTKQKNLKETSVEFLLSLPVAHSAIVPKAFLLEQIILQGHHATLSHDQFQVALVFRMKLVKYPYYVISSEIKHIFLPFWIKKNWFKNKIYNIWIW